MTELLISPAERPPITDLGTNSPLPEMMGSDVMWQGLNGMAGCQRKTVEDLIASVRPSPGAEPRLGKEIKQMTDSLTYRFLIIEGTPAWDAEGRLMSAHTTWTLKNHNGVLLSVQSQGIMCLTSRNAFETCKVIQHLVEWTHKTDHVSSLIARQKVPTDGWGRLDDRTTFIHVFSALPMVGTEMAARIFDALGNVLALTVTKEELMTVHGIGKRRAESIVRALSPSSPTSERSQES